MHHGTSRGKPKRIPRAGSAMTRRRGSAMTHHDLIRMTVDSRVLGRPQSRQINPNRGPSRAPTGLNPPPSPSTPLYWERRLISCSALHPTLTASSDGPPALVAHSPVGGLLSRFRPGETQSRRGTHSSDSVHSANPEECGAGVTHPDTAHEMRIPLRPLRMSKSYRRLRKRTLRSESAKALLEMSVPTVSPSSET